MSLRGNIFILENYIISMYGILKNIVEYMKRNIHVLFIC